MKKRFIAGAVCPRCAEMDRLVSYVPEGQSLPIRECVACGFSERLQEAQTEELPTRVNQPEPAPMAKPEVTEQVIRFVSASPHPPLNNEDDPEQTRH